MADLKITSLPALAEGSIQAADVLALADLSATETKKVTVKDLIAAGVALIDSGDIPAAKVATPLGANSVATATIQNDAVNADKLATDSVTADAVAANAIGASELANNAVDSGALATNSVITSKITDLNVTADKLASNAVTTVKILDANVTYAKLNLSDGDIPGAKITGNSITNAQIGADAVGSSELADNAVDTNAIVNSAVTNAKLANASISLGGLTLALGSTDATPALNLSDATNYPASSLSGTISNAQLNGSITGDKLANTTITYAKLNLSDGDIPAAKIDGNSITAAQIAANAITSSELADDAVDTAAVADGAITTTQIAANTITAGNLAANSVGASELADNAVDTAAIANGAITTDKIADGAITTAKLDGTIAASSIADNSVTGAKLAANAVGASELADNAVDTAAIAASAVTDAKVASGISGTKIGDGTITAAKLNTSNIDRSLNVASGNLGINNAVSGGAATRSGITYNAQGLITATAALAAGDLPISSTSAVGGVSIASAGGLAVTGAGAISIAATTTGATATKVTFNNFGQITSSASLAASDLPKATASAVGGVSVPSGGPLSVDSNGALTVGNSGVSAGTGTKLTVNAKGIVTAITNIADSDLPNHSAALLTSGTIAAARIANDSIDSSKLSNSSTTIIQSIAQLGYPTAAFTGQLLFDPIAEDAYLWDGNAWNPITTLTKGALQRFGTYNANTSQVDYVTAAGAAAGLTVGQNLPVASESVDGGYVVISVQGTPSGIAGITGQLSPPDYLLGVTTSASSSAWVEIDLSTTVASQQASAISYTPYGQLSATNVQAVINEIEDEKLSLAGGTITGQLLIGNAGSFVFEGATADAFETRLTVADPTTSDKVITLPNVTGTVITTGDTGTVTSAMIADGSIVNADVNASAAIALTKLQGIASAKIIVGNSSGVATEVAVTGDIAISNTGVTSIAAGAIVNADISGSAAIAGSKIASGSTSAAGVLQLVDSTTSTSTSLAATGASVKAAKDAADSAQTTANAALPKTGGTLTGNLILDNAKEVRFSEGDGDGSNYTGLKAQAQSADIVLTLPAVAPTTGQVLKAGSTATTLEWAADSATDATKLPLAGGTLTGNLILNAQSDVRFADADSSNYVALQSPATVGTSFTLTLPAADGSSGQALISDGSGNLSFSTVTTAAAGSNTQVQFNNSGSFAGSSSLTFNSGTGALTATSFVGNVTGNLTGNVTGNTSGSAGSCTGNAATATALASSVNIGGVAFDGTSSITLPGVNASGTQDTSGTAALATSFTVTANNSTDETVYPLFADGATGSQGAETDTGLTYNPSTGLLTSTSFAGNITGNVTGNCSGTSGGFTAGSASNLNAGTLPDARFPSTLPAASGANLTALNASNLSSGTVNVARLGSGSSVSTKFLRGDNTWQTISATPEGTAILSTGESGGTKFLREDGDGTCSWQTATTSAAGSNTQVQYNSSGSFAGSANLTFDGTHLSLADQSKLKLGASGDLEVFTDVGGDGMAHITSDLNLNINSDSTLSFKNNGSTKLSIDNSGVNGSQIHSLNASNLSSGTVATARLGSGSASSSTFLRGDGSWQTVSGTTINNNADNKIITGSGTANTLEAEANFVFNASNSRVGLGVTSPDTALHIAGADTSIIRLENTDTSLVLDQVVGGIEFEANDGAGVGDGVVSSIRSISEDSIGGKYGITFGCGGNYDDGSSSSKDFEAARFNQYGALLIGHEALNYQSNGAYGWSKTYDGKLSVVRDGANIIQAVHVGSSSSGLASLDLYKNNPSGQSDNDGIGGILFSAKNSAGHKETYARIYANSSDVTDGTENAELLFAQKIDGIERYLLSLSSSGAVTLRHLGTARLHTTSTGVTVSGALTATSFSGDGSALTGVGGYSTIIVATDSSNQNNISVNHDNALVVIAGGNVWSTINLYMGNVAGKKVTIRIIGDNFRQVSSSSGTIFEGHSNNTAAGKVYLDVPDSTTTLVYVDSTRGWTVVN